MYACSTKNWGVPRCVTICDKKRGSKLVQNSATYFMDGPYLGNDKRRVLSPCVVKLYETETETQFIETNILRFSFSFIHIYNRGTLISEIINVPNISITTTKR